MRAWRRIWRGLRALLRRDAEEQDVADEVRHYLDEAEADLVAGGLPPEEARRAVRLAHGDAATVRENVRAYGWERLAEALVSGRALRSAPSLAEPRLHRGGRVDAGPGHRIRDGDLQRREPRALPAAPLPGAGAARRDRRPCGRRLAAARHLRHLRGGVGARRCLRDPRGLPSLAAHRDRRGRAGAAGGPAGERRLLPGAGRVARAGAWLRRRRRPRGWSGRRGARRRAVAAPVRGGQHDRGPPGPPGRRALHGGGRHAPWLRERAGPPRRGCGRSCSTTPPSPASTAGSGATTSRCSDACARTCRPPPRGRSWMPSPPGRSPRCPGPRGRRWDRVSR